MKEVTREQWCAALRSGDYPQGQGQLHAEGGGYCCLGVLGELAGGVIDADDPGGMRFDWSTDSQQNGPYIPDSLALMVGITSDDQHDLANMNDRGKGRTFSEIADYIETLPFATVVGARTRSI
jgi:hypothetical protein